MAVEPFPFATVAQLRARWPQLPDLTEEQILAHLEDASQFMLDVAPATAGATPATRRRICCQVVRRALEAASANLGGLESVQIGTGPFQDVYKPVNPHGDYYLTAQEKKALGVGAQRAGSVDLLAGWQP